MLSEQLQQVPPGEPSWVRSLFTDPTAVGFSLPHPPLQSPPPPHPWLRSVEAGRKASSEGSSSSSRRKDARGGSGKKKETYSPLYSGKEKVKWLQSLLLLLREVS